MKRLIALGDTHCGHFAGLTPPGWQFSKTGHRKETAKQQRETWNWFAREVKPLTGADVAIWNGDLIDGRGERSGGTELITPDRLEQCAMAEAIVRTVGAQTNLFVHGTPYHTGQSEDFETQIAEEFDQQPHGHLWTNVNGWIVDAKHKVGSSGIPHGRHTAPAKERMWNVLWSEYQGQPKSHIILRSHVHYYSYCGGADWVAMTLPALQGFGSKFGERQCSGIVDFGFLHFDITEDAYTWQKHILRLKAAAPQVVTV